DGIRDRNVTGVQTCALPILTILKNKTSSKEESIERYMDDVFSTIKQRDPHETEFHQAVYDIFQSIKPALVKSPTYIQHNILERKIGRASCRERTKNKDVRIQ